MNSDKSFSLEETDKLILLAEKRTDYDAFESSHRNPNF
jgi:hypothetical protein